jgi:Fe2+ or Zn2+ uptake regulation protein
MKERITKYTEAVFAYMQSKGHATNADIAKHLRKTYPDISATTIHRITTRMVERSELVLAPPALGNLTRLDSNTADHHHFQCLRCDCLRDIDLPPDIIELIQDRLGDCQISGQLNIQGVCAHCLKEEK